MFAAFIKISALYNDEIDCRRLLVIYDIKVKDKDKSRVGSRNKNQTTGGANLRKRLTRPHCHRLGVSDADIQRLATMALD